MTATNKVPHATDWQQRVPTGSTATAVFGLVVVALFFGVFGVWAAKAPLAGAAIAPGVVIASGENQTVSHLEGGIIDKIVVRDGERVQQGQPLVYLDVTQAQANRNRIGQSITALKAKLIRASAEFSGATELTFPETLTNKLKADQDELILELQSAEFESRLEKHHSELKIQEEQISSLENEIRGIERQISAETTKLDILNNEIAAKKKLVKSGLTPKSQYNQLLRARADSQGRLGGLEATLGQRQNAISQIRQKKIVLKAARKSEASTEVNDLRRQLADLKEQLTSHSDVLDRMVIRAPADGIIVNIAKNTIGSVVAPGEAVLEVLPTNDELVISAHIAPRDVDVVKIGQNASIRFAALNVRTTPEVPATVEYVSADRITDNASKEPYFAARLKLTDSLPEEISSEQIFAGMPVETFINTGERTFVEYLMKPISDSFSKAFREE